MNGRRALIVATGAYRDAKLRQLRAPAADAERLAHVLRDPAIGDFDVDVALDQDESPLRRRIARFFADGGRDDVLLLHISSHGVKDAQGGLYLAASDTELDLLDATAVSAMWLDEQITRSRSRRKLLLLDCCFSGRFPFNATARAGDSVDVQERFQGRGRAVITASTAMEYAYEGDHLSGQGQPSYFTAALVDGLETGEADRDRDELISVDELYDYVYDRVKAATPNQTPTKQIALEGPLYVARSNLRRGIGATNRELREHRSQPDVIRPEQGVDGKTLWTRLVKFTNRRRWYILAGAAGVAIAAVGLVLVLSGPHPTTHPPAQFSKGGAGAVTWAGEVGPLQFGASTESDVARAAGAPDRTAQGSFELPNTPPYRALGYDCSTEQSPTRRSLTYTVRAPFCATVYYINANNRLLEAFWSTSNRFKSSQGVSPGMSVAAAASAENASLSLGCAGSTFTEGGSGYAAIVRLRATNTAATAPNSPSSRIVNIGAESNKNGIGLLKC
jgi:Caspase domain